MGLYHQFQTAVTFVNLIPFTQVPYKSLKRSYKAPVKKDWMRDSLFKSNQHLTHYSPLSFLMCSGGIEKQHRAVMG